MKKFLSLCLSLLLVLSLSACGNPKKELREEDFGIVTSFYPVYVTTINITEGADKVAVVNMTEPTVGCLHNYLLTNDDMDLLSKAEVFVANGMDMEAFVGKTSLGIPGLEIIDSGEDVPINLKERNKYNPHYWMSIENTIAQSEKITRNLVRIDPENKEIYTKNLEVYKAKLTGLLEEARTRFGTMEKKEIVVLGGSFDYLADELGLAAVKILPGHKFAKLSNEDISVVVDHIRARRVDTLIVEKNFEDAAALRTIMRQTGCKVERLDIVTGGSSAGNDKDAYVDAMRYNMDVLERVLSE